MTRCVLVSVLIGAVQAQPVAPSAKPGRATTNVKAQTKFVIGRVYCDGVVVEAGADSVTVRCEFPARNPPVFTRKVYPIDLLADGKIVDGISGSYAYLWSDIREGDTVKLEVVQDDGDRRDYCFAVRIERRPGGKLPSSQKPKEDGRFARDSLLNDLDNGEDVSDDDIGKVFPPVFSSARGREEPPRLLIPGGLSEEYQKKLDAIRAKKKEKELKATLPEKKDK